MSHQKTPYPIRLPDELREQLEKIAAADERSLNYVIVRALRAYVVYVAQSHTTQPQIGVHLTACADERRPVVASPPADLAACAVDTV